MSGGVSGTGSSSFRPDLDAAATEPQTTPEGDALLAELNAAKGSGPSWMSFLDGSSSLKPLAQRLAGDGKLEHPRHFGKLRLAAEIRLQFALRFHCPKNRL